ncbi:MAG TPA: class I SAM-dependent methyltransferase [Pirellulales bacterium]
MVHSPCFDPPSPGTLRHTAAELEAAADAAGRRMAADFERISAETGGFADRGLAAALVDAALGRCLRSLARLNCWGRDNQLPSARLWNAAAAWLEPGWLQHRARFKPRGYAGDYEMLVRLWNRTCAPQPLGAAQDQFFQRQAAVEAVRARIEQSAAALADHCLAADRPTYRVVSIGSGPAIELVELARMLPPERRQRLELVLMDLDEEALEFARASLAEYLPAQQVVLHRENLFRLSALDRLSRVFDRADAIVCLGLFDYLADEPATGLLRMIWQALAPDGLALVGNFAPHCPTRAYMEWVGNWYLIYRTAEELRHLASHAGLPPEGFDITAERLGVDLFIHARKPL